VLLTDRPSDPGYTVVGVVGATPGEKIADGPAGVVYFPVLDDAGDEDPKLPLVPRDLTLVVRTTLPPASMVATARRVVREMDPKLPIGRVRTMDEIVADSTAHTRLTAVLLLVAAGAALFLGVIGIYGMIAYTVSQRTSEFGVRMALGATPREVRRMVLGQGAALALGGIGIGLATAFALMRFLGSLVYEVSPSDPVVFAAMAALLFSVAVAASYFPAHRAGRVDPIRALKAE
jgi:predicted lysophospholipase L1 biosynthesis ABC-type transport system permease subunit